MSQSSLERATRRTLPAFSRTPSKLSQTPSKLAQSSSQSDLAALSADSPSASSSSRRSSSIHSTSLDAYATPEKDASRYRSTGTATFHSPHTPKIHYSPHATTTPREALSRSSSIPFDMAASAKAGRKAEQEARRRSSETPTDTPKSKGKAIVRRKTFTQRLKSGPIAIYDFFMLNYPTRVDDIIPSVEHANPIALGLQVLQWLLLAPLLRRQEETTSVLRSGAVKSGPGSRWDTVEDDASAGRGGIWGTWFTFIFTMILLGLACANSIYLFTRFRTYDMQLRSANEPIKSPHASPIAAPKAQTEDDVFGAGPSAQKSTTGSRNGKILRATVRTVVGLVRWALRTILSIFGHKSSTAPSFPASTEKIQSLRVWEPPEFCLAFFCAPLLGYLLTPLHPFLMPVLHLIISFLLSHLATSYAQLVKDRMVLSAEVMKEYDRRFVYKKVFAIQVDRSVQTEQAESLW